jgi:hypothetical protein
MRKIMALKEELPSFYEIISFAEILFILGLQIQLINKL